MQWLTDDYSSLLEWLGLISLLTFVGSLMIIPWIIARLPANYFITTGHSKRLFKNTYLRRIWLVVRNMPGLLLLLAGIAMLILPGQGIITMVIGISFMNFPQKIRLRNNLVRRPRVIRVLNWIRRRNHKPPFDL
jgi:hypothetical protein